jgi:hypothetical protein
MLVEEFGHPQTTDTMKRSSLLISTAVLILAAIFTTGCKEKGCTDPEAFNYDEMAQKDNGTCMFGGGMVFYYDEATSAQLVQDGAISLTYYLDDEIIGSSAADTYWTGVPYCGDNGAISVDKYWEADRTKTYSYSVVDQTGWEFWSGPITFHANTCVSTQLSAFKRKKK